MHAVPHFKKNGFDVQGHEIFYTILLSIGLFDYSDWKWITRLWKGCKILDRRILLIICHYISLKIMFLCMLRYWLKSRVKYVGDFSLWESYVQSLGQAIFSQTYAFMQKCMRINLVIMSPRYTGGDFMFLYRFVRRRRRRRRPPILVHAITFQQLFGFLLFLAWLLALTCRLPD